VPVESTDASNAYQLLGETMKKKLTNEHQVFIVQCLAYFMMPSEIVEALKAEFNITISRELVRRYNPNQVHRSKNKWGKIFDEARKAYLEAPHDIGIAHLTHRLDRLNQMMVNAIRLKNYPLAAQLIEQAAKDNGGLFTNKQMQEVRVDQRLQLPSVADWKKEHARRRAAAEATMAEFEEDCG
jgi:hypothetical protein